MKANMTTDPKSNPYDPTQPEFRRDPVTGDWIILASGRSKRPEQMNIKKAKRVRVPLKDSPFAAMPVLDGASVVYYRTKKKNDWSLQIIPNKYPLLKHLGACTEISSYGPYQHAAGVGSHDLVLTKSYYKNFPMLDSRDAFDVFRAFQGRYWQLAEDPCLRYFFALHNWGPKAGASIYHPHYQVLALPIIPRGVYRSLSGSRKYYERHGKFVHSEIIAWERSQKERIIFENKGAIAFAPYASRFPFELKVFPKKRLPYFEDTTKEDMKYLVEILQKTLSALTKNAGDPDYNFYVHTAPMRNREAYFHYHWHVEILPHMKVEGSVEIGTGIDINTVHPGDAATLLRS
jgi:UDPglucose--hexose-1-phosphate uridylyltransferase